MSSGAPCAAGAGASDARLLEVGRGVHAWVQPDGTWWVNNAGVVVDEDSTVLIDTCATATRTRRLLDAVETVASGPVTTAVLTHAHGDHAYGAGLLPASTEVVAHQATEVALADDPVLDGCPPFWSPVPDWGDLRRRLPDTTVADRSTLDRRRRVEVLHPGGVAHTPGDLVVWLPDDGVLFAGDLLFHGLTPLVLSGSVAGARRSLPWLAGFGADVVVPGHGPVIPGSDLSRVLDEHDSYYALVERTARSGIDGGMAPLDAARACDLGGFADWADAERLVLNLHRAYAELGGPAMDVVAAFGDAIAWNGGPMTTHVCC